MSDRTGRLLLFARAPVLGCVKTRLQPELDEEQSLMLHRALVRDAVALIRRTAPDLNADAEISFSEPIGDADEFAQATVDLRVTTQRGDDLGERLVHAFQERLRPPVRRVVVIGSDSPTLTGADLAEAFGALDRSEVVIGPAEDGGYVLIGCSRMHVRPFQRIPWGTDRVLAETRRRLKKEKIPHVLLRAGRDLDTVQDLLRTWRELEHLQEVGAEEPAPETLAALRDIMHQTPELHARLRT